MQELEALKSELALKGEELTTSLIMERFGLSRRQALRYLQKLENSSKPELDAELGMALAGRYLRSLPRVNDVLRSDLEALGQLQSESESESLALIKARREQALAIARLGGQFLKELRDLGLIENPPKGSSEEGECDESISLADHSELHAEVSEAAERELQEFQRELEGTA